MAPGAKLSRSSLYETSCSMIRRIRGLPGVRRCCPWSAYAGFEGCRVRRCCPWSAWRQSQDRAVPIGRSEYWWNVNILHVVDGELGGLIFDDREIFNGVKCVLQNGTLLGVGQTVGRGNQRSSESGRGRVVQYPVRAAFASVFTERPFDVFLDLHPRFRRSKQKDASPGTRRGRPLHLVNAFM